MDASISAGGGVRSRDITPPRRVVHPRSPDPPPTDPSYEYEEEEEEEGEGESSVDEPEVDALAVAFNGTAAEVTAVLRADRKLVHFRSPLKTTMLHAACAAGNVATVSLLLKRGADITARDAVYGLTPLHEAVIRGHKAVVEALVGLGTNLNPRSKRGWTPVCYSVMQGNLDMVRFLASVGTDLTATDREGVGLMHIAAIAGHVNILEYLTVEQGMDVNARTTEREGNTPLILATAYRRTEAVRRLLELGAVAHVANNDGITASAVAGATATPLGSLLSPSSVAGIEHNIRCPVDCRIHAAAAGCDASLLAQEFATYPLPVNHTDELSRTPLHVAAGIGCGPVVEYLLGRAAEPSLTDADGLTALHVAAAGGHYDVAAALVAHDASLLAADAPTGTPLFAAAGCGSVELVDLFIESGAEVDHKTADGRTALFTAAIAGHSAVVSYLLDRGCNFRIFDKTLKTPLHLACEAGRTDVAITLIAAGIEVDVRDGVRATPLHACAAYNRTDTGSMLLLKGANVNAVTQQWSSALHVSAAHGHASFAELLVNNGANLAMKTQDGQTALDVAHSHQHYAFEERLQAAAIKHSKKCVPPFSRAMLGFRAKTAVATAVPARAVRSSMALESDAQKAVMLVSSVVGAWAPSYMHCLKYIGPTEVEDDPTAAAHAVDVIWSKPTPSTPIPKDTVTGHFTVVMPEAGVGASGGEQPGMWFHIEHQSLVHVVPPEAVSGGDTGFFSESWLDFACRQKKGWRARFADI